MAKYKNRKKKTTSVKEVDVIEENLDEEELDEELEEEVEEVEEIDEVEDDEEEEEYDDDYEEVPLEERLASIEKKTNVTFWLVIAILVVVSLNMLFTLNGNSNEDTTTAPDTTQSTNSQSTSGYDTSAFNTITPDKIKSLSDGKTIVVWLGYQGCGYCQQYAPVLAQVTKEFGITANYVNVQTLTEDGLNTILSLTGSGEWKEFASTFKGTPFTLIIKNNKVVGGVKGAVDANTITKTFEDAGLKK